MKSVKVGDLTIGNDSPLVLIAGTCVLEEESLILRHVERLKGISERTGVPLIYKGSYDKANKTVAGSYRGPGIEKGLRLLNKVKGEFGVPVTSDVHWLGDIDAAAEVLDLIQIPAALCKQIDLVVGAARRCKAVNIKKGQFVSPWNMKNLILAIERDTDNRNIILTERGTVFGVDAMVNDFRSLDIMKSFGYPVFFDASHSCVCPKEFAGDIGGCREFIPTLARASVAVGIAGLFVEVHEEPAKALSDPDVAYRLDGLEDLLNLLKVIDSQVKKHGKEFAGP